MSPESVILLGFIQGLTEFLPISSSGHLVFIQQYLKLAEADLFLDAVLHMGSLLAIVIFFSGRLACLLKSFRTTDRWQVPRTVRLAAIASLPAFMVGFVFHHPISRLFTNPVFLPYTFAITGLLLLSVKRKKGSPTGHKAGQMTYYQALVVGLWQALAILPGISRSGSTYAAGRWQGLKPASAFYFSFLIAIPAIAGAFFLEFINHGLVLSSTAIIGFFTSTVFSLIGLYFFRWLIKSQKLHWLSLYCFGLSILAWRVF